MDEMTVEQARRQLETLLGSGEMEILAVRAQAVAKQQEASALLDQVDRMEHVAALGAALESAHGEVAQTAARADRLAEAAKTALTNERAAQDRLTEAVEHARHAAEAEEVARLEDAAPAVQTDTLLRLNAAREVEARRQQIADRATAAREATDAEVTEARGAVSRARATAKAAQERLDNADQDIPVSAATLLIDWAARLLRHTSGTARLTDSQLSVLRPIIDEFAGNLGLRDRYRAEGRDQLDREIKQRQESMYLPKPGHPLRPASSGQTFMPVVPPLNGR